MKTLLLVCLYVAKGAVVTVGMLTVLPVWFIIGGLYHVGKGESPLALFKEVEWALDRIMPNLGATP